MFRLMLVCIHQTYTILESDYSKVVKNSFGKVIAN